MGQVGISLEGRRRKPESLARLKQAARKLFVERGYDATRPQDIAREAGLGHGTFYLHYPDKRACFLSFVEDARQDLDAHLRERRQPGATLESRVATMLNGMYDYSDRHPGLLRAALTDECVIDAEGVAARPLVMQWGDEWAEMIREAVAEGKASASFNVEIIGQAIVGALHQTGREAHRSGRCREELVKNLTSFVTKALRPD
ncbi:MAG TPA: TetR/AcrR family transcriptional regulator [Rhizomicrobium sp.]|jgi:AcrR family transcriptional regulator|nr:TetR/AcrR family transcriptional regulator [Rhizomicrobium sp.]